MPAGIQRDGLEPARRVADASSRPWRRMNVVAGGTIKMMCPNLRCRAVLGVPTEARGRTVRCRNCGNNIRIPKATVAPPTPPPTDQDDQQSSENAA